jgi:predicted regulator of Ras-like GTPase activity (Roadblock/LC7/MglB family)
MRPVAPPPERRSGDVVTGPAGSTVGIDSPGGASFQHARREAPNGEVRAEEIAAPAGGEVVSMMAVAGARDELAALRAQLHARAAALIRADGTVVVADLSASTFVETFAIMCATAFGSSVAALAEVDRPAPDRVRVEGPDAQLLLLRAGPAEILALVLERDASVDDATTAGAVWAGRWTAR